MTVAAGTAIVTANYLLLRFGATPLSPTVANADQALLICVAAASLAASIGIAFASFRQYLSPGHWRWRRGIVWIMSFACVLVIGALFQIVASLTGTCLGSYQCRTLYLAENAVVFVLPVAALAGLAWMLSQRDRVGPDRA